MLKPYIRCIYIQWYVSLGQDLSKKLPLKQGVKGAVIYYFVMKLK
jgi:hypothetical protein